MSWMDIDNMSCLNCVNGAGGVRQAGRYLLILKADELKTRIQDACISAMEAVQNRSLTVYIFAGISGGTGSGCFNGNSFKITCFNRRFYSQQK